MSIIEKVVNRLNDENKFDGTPVENEASATVKINQQSATKPSKRFHIDPSFLSTAGIISNNAIVPYVADEYRRIKRPLLANAFGNESQLVERGNLVVVTSSLPGEGKSFTSLNLALSISMERDRTVLLVDADVTKSRVTNLLKLNDQKGLTDALVDPNMDLKEVIIKTDFPGLSVIPSGRSHSHTAELLASERMGQLLDELASRYSNRIILFDTPPVLVTPETQILCDRVGQVVFVVEMGVTARGIVEQALALIPNENKAVGIVLNKARKMSSQADYGYGYGGY